MPYVHRIVHFRNPRRIRHKYVCKMYLLSLSLSPSCSSFLHAHTYTYVHGAMSYAALARGCETPRGLIGKTVLYRMPAVRSLVGHASISAPCSSIELVLSGLFPCTWMPAPTLVRALVQRGLPAIKLLHQTFLELLLGSASVMTVVESSIRIIFHLRFVEKVGSVTFTGLTVWSFLLKWRLMSLFRRSYWHGTNSIT